MQHLAVGMLRGLERDAGGAVQLAHDDALGAVDDKRALGRHERQFAHENSFLFAALLVFEQERHVKRRAIRQALAQAFQPIHLRLADFVGMKVQDAFPVVAFDGEDLFENRLEAQKLALGRRRIGLQEFDVRIGLQFDQVGRRDDFFNFTEVDTFSCSRWHFDLYWVAGDSPDRFIYYKRHDARPLRSTRHPMSGRQ